MTHRATRTIHGTVTGPLVPQYAETEAEIVVCSGCHRPLTEGTGDSTDVCAGDGRGGTLCHGCGCETSYPLDAPEITPAQLALQRQRDGAGPSPACVTCGAIHYGNMSCERCLLTWTSGDWRWWLLRCARVRVEWRP